jgi:ribonuclease HI
VTRAEGPLVAVFADESCLGNGREGSNPGGAAGVLELIVKGALVRYDYWVSEPATTNNRMALRSAIEALRILSAKGKRCRVVFTSDSQYLVTGNNEWIYGWMKRGWKRSGGKLENAELWMDLAEARRAHDVQWKWVRGHRGHPQNEYANDLAVAAATELTQSHGAVESGFDAWLAARKDKAVQPELFPNAADFRPSPPLPAPPSESQF